MNPSLPKRSLSQLAVPLGVVAVILMMVVPVPAALLDYFIAFNIVGAMVSRIMEFHSGLASDKNAGHARRGRRNRLRASTWRSLRLRWRPALQNSV